MKKILSFLLIIALLAGCFTFAGAESFPEKDLIILYTGDVHCAIDKGWGYAGLYAMKEALAKDHDVLLVDSGDHLSGETPGMLTRGSAIIEIMNTLGYDAVTLGNHEFGYGPDRLAELAGMANFPYVCCNYLKEGEPVFAPYVIKEAGSKKVAFIGVTTPLSLMSAVPKYYQNDQGEYIYDLMGDQTGEKLCAAVQKSVDEATAEGADYVILLAHLGNNDSCRPYTYADVISGTTGITAVVDGHSHDIDQIRMKNKDGKEVVRTACATQMENIGALTITADGKVSSELFPWATASFSAPELLGLDNPTETTVEEVLKRLNEQTSQVIMRIPVDLLRMDPGIRDENGNPIPIDYSTETNLQALVADAYQASSGGADFTLTAASSVRDEIHAGDLSMGDVLRVLPYSNTLTLAECTGQQVLDALEWGAHSLPGIFGGFLEVSGLTYEVNPTIPSPCVQDDQNRLDHIDGNMARRVGNVLVNGVPLDPEKTYKVCMTSYLFEGGYGYSMFEGCTALLQDMAADNEALINYLKSLPDGALQERYGDPYGDGRIVAVGENRAE